MITMFRRMKIEFCNVKNMRHCKIRTKQTLLKIIFDDAPPLKSWKILFCNFATGYGGGVLVD